MCFIDAVEYIYMNILLTKSTEFLTKCGLKQLAHNYIRLHWLHCCRMQISLLDRQPRGRLGNALLLFVSIKQCILQAWISCRLSEWSEWCVCVCVCMHGQQAEFLAVDNGLFGRLCRSSRRVWFVLSSDSGWIHLMQLTQSPQSPSSPPHYWHLAGHPPSLLASFLPLFRWVTV